MVAAIVLATIVFFILNHYCKSKKSPKANRFIISGFCGVATFIIMVGIFGPGKETEPENIAVADIASPAAAQETTPKTILPMEEWQKLYQELESEIKQDSVFLEYGFSANGQRSHQQWIEKVNAHLLPLDVNPAWQSTPSNLRGLAIAYVREDSAAISRLTKELNKVFDYGT